MEALAQNAHSCQHHWPANFFPAGDVRWTSMCTVPPFIQAARKRPSKGVLAQGLAYERKVQEELLANYPDSYLPGPWFLFRSANSSRDRYCQPDGLIFDPWAGTIHIVEIKVKHCALAWWQLFHLYAPIVQKCFGPLWTIKCVEVVRWFDPSTSVPQKPQLRSNILHVGVGEFAVHIFG